jgi:cell division transport system permease protein
MKRILTYFERHAQAFVGSLGALTRTPLASLMTIAVIGITLALPTALLIAVNNAVRVSSGWEGPGRISLFLKSDAGDAQAQKLSEKLSKHPKIATIDVISRDKALDEFKRHSGFGDALNALDRNPLPAVLVIHPIAEAENTQALNELVLEFNKLDEVDFAQIDLEWVERLQAWLDIVRRATAILGGLLALAVLLIIGNTIRMAVLSRQDEIEVSQLVGATDAFIRRPFLYSGLVQGLLGAALAGVLVQMGIWLLAGPIQTLSGLYGSDFRLAGLNLDTSATLLIAGAALGWVGARIAVGRHLQRLDSI